MSHVCLEASGQYHPAPALALDDAELARMVINPKAANRFAEAIRTRTKTDAVDAAVLAQFALRMPFTPVAPPTHGPWPSALMPAASRRSTSSMRCSKPR